MRMFNFSGFGFVFLMVMSLSFLELLETYMVINFRTYRISRDALKLTWIHTLINKKIEKGTCKKNHHHLFFKKML
jgi:hypothetical protein